MYVNILGLVSAVSSKMKAKTTEDDFTDRVRSVGCILNMFSKF